MRKHRLGHLILKAARGDDEALVELLGRLDPLITRLARRGGRADPDAKAEIVVRLIEALRSRRFPAGSGESSRHRRDQS